MAVLLLTMLAIGVSMVASLGDYHALVAIHRPLGIAILIGDHSAGQPPFNHRRFRRRCLAGAG
jgi:hypothetical protein